MEWHDSAPLPWPDEVARFFATLGRFDARLAIGPPLWMTVEKLFQGPVADAFTHIGQIVMLRGMSGAPLSGENYFRAEIVAGRVGSEQAERKRKFG